MEWKNEASVAFVAKEPTVACKYELLAKYPHMCLLGWGMPEHLMNNVSQMHVFDLFPWREGVEERFPPQVVPRL